MYNLKKNDPKYIPPDTDDEYHIDTERAIKFKLEQRLYDSPMNYFDYGRLIHPADFHSQQLIATKSFFRTNPQEILLARPYTKMLRGIPLKTQEDVEIEYEKDEVVIEVEKLNLWRDVIFFKFLNPKKELPEMHKVIHGFFWSLVYVALLHGFYLAYTAYLRSQKRDLDKKQINTQKEQAKVAELMSQSKSPGTMMTGFNYKMHMKHLDWAFRDMLENTEDKTPPKNLVN